MPISRTMQSVGGLSYTDFYYVYMYSLLLFSIAYENSTLLHWLRSLMNVNILGISHS